MSKSQSSGLNSSISFPSQHRAHRSVGGAGGDVGLLTKPRSQDTPPHTHTQPTHPNPIPTFQPHRCTQRRLRGWGWRKR